MSHPHDEPGDAAPQPGSAPPPSGGYSLPPAGGGYSPPPASGYSPPPAPGYGMPPPPPAEGYPGAFGQYGYGPPATGPVRGNYADWGTRVLSGLIDFVGPGIVAGLLFVINDTLGWLAYLAALAWAVYNAYLGGQTGQSYGKKQVGTRLLSEQSGQPIGGGMGIARYFLHIVDGLPCYLGYLWPLWDSKRQTFADKILKTVVVKG